MKSMKSEIELRLIGSLLADWCRQNAETAQHFIYKSRFDSAHRVIRFATPVLQSLFSLPENQTGYWKCGIPLMYELCNEMEGVSLRCVASPIGLNKAELARMKMLAEACGAVECHEVYELVRWNVSDEAEHTGQIEEVLNQLLAFEVARFESELAIWKEEPTHKLRLFRQDTHVLVRREEMPVEIYMEGAQKTILTNRYERNPKARARCIAVHGSACKVCGFDFGAVFGEAYAGKIEVHHIKPISEIGENYVVDPKRDLVPVCPNCHMMLHSSPDGVFGIKELKSMRRNDYV